MYVFVRIRQMETAKLITKYTCHEHHVISLLIHLHTHSHIHKTVYIWCDVCCTLQYFPFSFICIRGEFAQPGPSLWPMAKLPFRVFDCWNIIEWDGQWSKSNWNRLYIATERSEEQQQHQIPSKCDAYRLFSIRMLFKFAGYQIGKSYCFTVRSCLFTTPFEKNNTPSMTVMRTATAAPVVVVVVGWSIPCQWHIRFSLEFFGSMHRFIPFESDNL